MILRDTKRDFTDSGNDFLTFSITVFASFVTRYVGVIVCFDQNLDRRKEMERVRERVSECESDGDKFKRERERERERERGREKEIEVKRERVRKREGQKKVEANILRKVKRCGALRKCPPPVRKLENIAYIRKFTISSNFS